MVCNEKEAAKCRPLERFPSRGESVKTMSENGGGGEPFRQPKGGHCGWTRQEREEAGLTAGTMALGTFQNRRECLD